MSQTGEGNSYYEMIILQRDKTPVVEYSESVFPEDKVDEERKCLTEVLVEIINTHCYRFYATLSADDFLVKLAENSRSAIDQAIRELADPSIGEEGGALWRDDQLLLSVTINRVEGGVTRKVAWAKFRRNLTYDLTFQADLDEEDEDEDMADDFEEENDHYQAQVSLAHPIAIDIRLRLPTQEEMAPLASIADVAANAAAHDADNGSDQAAEDDRVAVADQSGQSM